MDSVRDAWTDERLDDLAQRMDNGFDRVDRDIREVRTEVRDLRAEMNFRFDAVTVRIEALQRTLIQVAGGLGAVVLAGILADRL